LANNRQELSKEVELMLGGGMVDVELDPEHYELSVQKALDRFRQRSDSAVEESFMVLNLIEDQNEYVLPEIVIDVRDIYRRSSGQSLDTGPNFEPFEAGYLNTYLLHHARSSGLLTFELYSGFVESLGKMLGYEYIFQFRRHNHTILINRRIKGDSQVYLHCFNYMPDDILVKDTYTGPWVRSWALAEAKLMLGQARSKFGQITGPQGGTTLNGDAIKAEAQTEMVALEEEIKTYQAGNQGLGVLIG